MGHKLLEHLGTQKKHERSRPIIDCPARNNSIDTNNLLLAIPINIQTGKLSAIEETLGWVIWGWLLEQFVDAKIAKRTTVA